MSYLNSVDKSIFIKIYKNNLLFADNMNSQNGAATECKFEKCDKINVPK